MFWRKKRTMDDLAEEFQSHVAIEASETGSTEAARRAFGNVTSLQEALYERSRVRLWDNLVGDFRHAVRLLTRRPGFGAVVVLTLALGIGANTAIFSLIDAVLLRPLPYKDPSRLAMLWMEDPAHNVHEETVSLPNFYDWKRQNRSFEDMAIFTGQTFLLGTDGSPERLRSARVPANFFSLLGVEPMLGRVFSRTEEDRGERVVVLSHGLWQRQFGGSPHAIGSELTMDGRRSRIIGVMPPSFHLPFPDTQVWEPVTTHPYWAARNRNSPRSSSDWYVVSRVKRGIPWAQAQAEMSTLARRLYQQYPKAQNLPDVCVVPLHLQSTGKARLSLGILFAAVFLMLLIACINVASLLLARGSAREREFSLRRALGAGRARIAAQLLTESLVLSAAGGLLGLLFAAAGLKALVAFGPQDIPRLSEAHLDPLVLLFTVAISLFAALVSGLWPALQSGMSLTNSRQWTTLAHREVRGMLVAGEYALALVLLTGAGLLVHSFVRLQAVDPGFWPSHLLSMRIDLHVGKNPTQRVEYFRNAIDRVRTLPGVRSAGAIGRFLWSYTPQPVVVERRPLDRAFQATDDVVSGSFFQTAGIPLKKGRFFTDQDRADSTPVAIINEAMARSFWPYENPIGKRFNFPDPDRPSSPWFTVVGIVGDTRRQGIDKDVSPQAFRPHTQNPDNELDLLVRTTTDPVAAAAAIRDSIQAMDKTVAKFGVTTVEKQLGGQTAKRRFDTSLLGLFSLVALFLSAIGIYGLMHYSVVQRTHEIGVRMALGARYGNVLALVLRQGLMLAATGIAVGILGALGLTRMLSSLLFGVTATDPLAFAAAPVVLLGVAVLACWLPARRAARLDPMLALRQE